MRNSNPDYRADISTTLRYHSPPFDRVLNLLMLKHPDEAQYRIEIFEAGMEYRTMYSDRHKSLLRSLFDSLAISEYLLSMHHQNPSEMSIKLILINMELYLKTSIATADKWLHPTELKEGELIQLERQLPIILNKISRITA